MSAGPLLEVEDLHKHYGETRALQGVSLDVTQGESFAIVGESGSGKTTLARMIMMLDTPNAGRISFDGQDLQSKRAFLRWYRGQTQIVLQDPYGSLSPRMRVRTIVSEPLIANSDQSRDGRQRRALEMLERVGLSADFGDRFPHELSGGQRQRVALARALVVSPRLLVLDEPVASLDVSVRAQILNLLADLQDELGLTYLLISHDLATVQHVCSRVAVMRGGQVVEAGSIDTVFGAPQHQYTRDLIRAIPDPFGAFT